MRADPRLQRGEAPPGPPPAPVIAPPPALTPRQLEIVELVGQGLTNSEIAERLGISAATVKRHLERIFDRVGVRTRAGAALRVLSDRGARGLA